MNSKTTSYFNRLIEKYGAYGDNESLLALADVAEQDERVRELRIYREQPKTQELINAALERIKTCIQKLTAPDTALKMNDTERANLFAAMDWARFTLDIVGEDPDRAEKMVDDIVDSYAKKAGISTE